MENKKFKTYLKNQDIYTDYPFKGLTRTIYEDDEGLLFVKINGFYKRVIRENGQWELFRD